MDRKEQIKKALCDRIDQDERYADEVGYALDTGDIGYLIDLIEMVVGAIFEIIEDIFDWVKSWFT